ncbi:DUF3164 family protein [Sapientia aquatica]|uniref:DUF3164 family protein n=1 Tax=Sapientia aquatica TaxID=1549640 RepID=A0A4R5W3U9_9BURK|nr:DUF3164 family protein [Sapientia aquatica]TDK66009.1 DUF3164 family protein [Sapientia aquatica]
MDAALETQSGYRTDAQGRLVPESLIKPVDKIRDELVVDIVERAKELSIRLAKFKVSVLQDSRAFVQLSAEQYGVSLGGKKGNVTLYSFDSKYKIQLTVAENIQFDERLQAAKALIDECINEWARNSSDEIKVLVQDAFQTDKEGRISTGRVLGLRRLEIVDEKWLQAMRAIGESVQVIGSKEYIRFYERVEGADQYSPVSLDIAAL